MAPQLCLGTAQFGLDYGVTNAAGQVGESEVARILQAAAEAGIVWIDTAQAYGSAEAILGRNWPADHRFRVISKLPAQGAEAFDAVCEAAWEQQFQRSLKRLGLSRLDSFLLHRPADLCRPDSDLLLAWLESLRARGLVRRLGVSIYDSTDLDGLPLEHFQVVQLPLSLYDQRLLDDGTISRLRQAGVAVHARSIYLQGLLLTPVEQWPDWVSPATRNHHQKLTQQALSLNSSLMDLALGFARAQYNLECIVVGVCSKSQLQELIHHWSLCSAYQLDYASEWALSDFSVIDPRIWSQYK